MPWISSGLVSTCTRMAFAPFAAAASASSALKNACDAAPAKPAALGYHITGRVRIEPRMQQLIERRRLRPGRPLPSFRSGLPSPSQPLFGSPPPSCLAGTRLQHVELVLLDCELDVLHVAVVLLKIFRISTSCRKTLAHGLFHRRQARALGFLASDRQLLRRCGCRRRHPRLGH